MSLKNLAVIIQSSPENVKALIESYQEVCDQSTSIFLESIKNNVVYVIPALINAYDSSIPSIPDTLAAVVESMNGLTLFDVVSTGESYLFSGIDSRGNLTAMKLGNIYQEIMTGKEVISRKF